MTDTAGAGIAVGAAIVGRRPIFIMRFQSFVWLNSSPIVMHAAKAKEVFGYPAPVFVRAIASEGDGAGPLHSNCYHSPFMHMPGIPVCAPMTPNEYEDIWSHYVSHDDPLFVSEHRRSYKNANELPDQIDDKASITLYPVSAARFSAIEAAKLLREQGVACNIVHVVWLKPFELTDRTIRPLVKSGKGLVIDSSYEIAGAARSIAFDLMSKTRLPVGALGQSDRSPGVAKHLENGTPTPERIASAALEIIGQKEHA